MLDGTSWHVYEMLAYTMVSFSLATHDPVLQQFSSLSALTMGYWLNYFPQNVVSVIISVLQ